MPQVWFERVLFCFLREMVAARTEIPRTDNRTRRNFLPKIEIVLNLAYGNFGRYVVERMSIGCASTAFCGLRKLGEHECTLNRKMEIKTGSMPKMPHRELISKDACSAPNYSLTVAEDVPMQNQLNATEDPAVSAQIPCQQLARSPLRGQQ